MPFWPVVRPTALVVKAALDGDDGMIILKPTTLELSCLRGASHDSIRSVTGGYALLHTSVVRKDFLARTRGA